MSKQTAVEWLIDEIVNHNGVNSKTFEQAKAMHKEEHGETWDIAIQQYCKRGGNVSRAWEDFDEYYNETYKGGANE